MSHVSFYPGPSRVYSNTTEFIFEAYASGILSVNHRSEEFMQLFSKLKRTLKKKLLIPADYEIAFVSSATECWEIISQSLVSHRFAVAHNGAFGAKWAAYAQALTEECKEIPFQIEEILPVERLVQPQADVVGLVHNETSNGTYIADRLLLELRSKLPNDTLVAVDATSSMAGVHLPYYTADVWFASVQKCFGLPSGMAILVVSPRAVERAYRLNRNQPYNSLMRIIENTKNHQTHYTPNILNMYLMYRTQSLSKGMEYQHEKTWRRFDNWKLLLEQVAGVNWLIKNEEVKPPTVLALTARNIESLKQAAHSKGFILGNGYGDWKDTTFRIANFPAIKGKEVERLAKFLRRYQY